MLKYVALKSSLYCKTPSLIYPSYQLSQKSVSLFSNKPPETPPQIEMLFQPGQTLQNNLKDASMSIEFMYNTPVVEKLRKISEKKWYQL